jgi:hypothetical protein
MGLAKEVQKLIAGKERVTYNATSSTDRPRRGGTRGGWLGARGLGRGGGGLEVGSGRHSQSRRRVSLRRGESEGVMVGKGSLNLGGTENLISLLKGSSERGVGLRKTHEEDNSMELIVNISQSESLGSGLLEFPHGSRHPTGIGEQILTLPEVNGGKSLISIESSTSLLRSKESSKRFPHGLGIIFMLSNQILSLRA